MNILNWSKEPKNRLLLYQALLDYKNGPPDYFYCCNVLNTNLYNYIQELGVDPYHIVGYRKDYYKPVLSKWEFFLEDILPELFKYKQLNITPGDHGQVWFKNYEERKKALQLAYDDLGVGSNIPITV